MRLFQQLNQIRNFFAILILSLFVCQSVFAQSTEDRYPDSAFLLDGDVLKCLVDSVNSTTLFVKTESGASQVPLQKVMSFAIGTKDRLDKISIPPAVFASKYYSEQDLLLVNNTGERLLVDLQGITTSFFIYKKLTGDTATYTLPVDSVAVFLSNKPFVKGALDEFSHLNRIYAPNQDFERVLKKHTTVGNWNSDAIVLSDGQVERVLIQNVDSVKGITAIPAYFTPSNYKPKLYSWDQIKAFDYFENPNPFSKPSWYGVADDMRENKLVAVIARPLKGNLQFVNTRLKDEIKETGRRHRWLFLKGGILATGGLATFFTGYYTLNRSLSNENDAGSVASVGTMAAGLTLLGWGINELIDAALNYQTYSRIKKINNSLRFGVGPTSMAVKLTF